MEDVSRMSAMNCINCLDPNNNTLEPKNDMVAITLCLRNPPSRMNVTLSSRLVP